MERAVFKVLDNLGHVGDQRVEVSDTHVQVRNSFSLEGANDNAVNKFNNIEGADSESITAALAGVWTDLRSDRCNQKAKGKTCFHFCYYL